MLIVHLNHLHMRLHHLHMRLHVHHLHMQLLNVGAIDSFHSGKATWQKLICESAVNQDSQKQVSTRVDYKGKNTYVF